MGLLEWLMPPSIFNVFQPRLLDKEQQGAQLEQDPEFRPALLVVDMQEDFCPPVSFLSGPASCALLYKIHRHEISFELFLPSGRHSPCAFCSEIPPSSSLPFTQDNQEIVQWGKHVVRVTV